MVSGQIGQEKQELELEDRDKLVLNSWRKTKNAVLVWSIHFFR